MHSDLCCEKLKHILLVFITTGTFNLLSKILYGCPPERDRLDRGCGLATAVLELVSGLSPSISAATNLSKSDQHLLEPFGSRARNFLSLIHISEPTRPY